jgi:RNA polymerase sigma factor (sigma-70 family)
MIAPEDMCSVDKSDAELVADSLAGDRSAFKEIVTRHQRTIAGLAYSATGSLHTSEDLAQEIFIRAWKELPRLREPAKLRSWLCSIARFVISKARRRENLQPVHSASPLDSVPEVPDIEPLPSEGAIKKEEAMILWRSLEKLPELYREPLVLFYREHRSIQSVAAALDLTEDTVKQRLARGRKLLHREVLLFVESALERTNPGPALGVSVIAAIGIGTTSIKAATLGTVALSGKSSGAAKGIGLLGVVGIAALLAAAVGGQIASLWGRVQSGRSPRERRFLAQSTLDLAGWKLLLVAGVLGLRSIQDDAVIINNLSDAVPWIALWVALLGVWVAYSVWMTRRQKAIRLAEKPLLATNTGKPEGSVDEPAALAARVYGGLAAWIFGPGGLLIWLTHSKGNHIASAILLVLSVTAWLVSARICLRHPGRIGRVFSIILWGQAVVVLAVINLLSGSWTGHPGELRFAPAVVNCLVLVFYGSLVLAHWAQARLTRTA